MTTEKQSEQLILYEGGGIQHTTATPWRDRCTQVVESIGGMAVNPVKDNGKIFNKAVLGFHDDGSVKAIEWLVENEETKAAMLYKQTEENDKYYIKNVCNVIFIYYDSRAGHGTKTEFDLACDINKKIILVRGVPRKKMAHWNYWRRVFGKMSGQIIEFGDLDSAFEYIKITYKEGFVNNV